MSTVEIVLKNKTLTGRLINAVMLPRRCAIAVTPPSQHPSWFVLEAGVTAIAQRRSITWGRKEGVIITPKSPQGDFYPLSPFKGVNVITNVITAVMAVNNMIGRAATNNTVTISPPSQKQKRCLPPRAHTLLRNKENFLQGRGLWG